MREMIVGLAPAIVIRASYTGDLGYEIWVAPDDQVTLYETLIEAGQDLGLRLFGGRALTSLRLEKGYGAFLREFRPDYTPRESGLGRFVAYDKTDFIGREAAPKDRDTRPARKLVPLIVETDVDAVGYKSVMLGEEAVGQVTSGAYCHWAGKSVAMAYVRSDLACDGAELKVLIFGKACPARVATVPLFDANGGRQRGSAAGCPTPNAATTVGQPVVIRRCGAAGARRDRHRASHSANLCRHREAQDRS